MERLHIDGTERSPEIDFDFHTNMYAIRGESYPEDVPGFYGPVIGRLEAHFDRLEGADITFDIEMVYFNSTSAKIFMGLLEMLDRTAEKGNRVAINWHFEEDDDNMEEFGQEFGEDLEFAQFNMIAKAGS